jgi:hypothetical protein
VNDASDVGVPHIVGGNHRSGILASSSVLVCESDSDPIKAASCAAANWDQDPPLATILAYKESA